MANANKVKSFLKRCTDRTIKHVYLFDPIFAAASDHFKSAAEIVKAEGVKSIRDLKRDPFLLLGRKPRARNMSSEQKALCATMLQKIGRVPHDWMLYLNGQPLVYSHYMDRSGSVAVRRVRLQSGTATSRDYLTKDKHLVPNHEIAMALFEAADQKVGLELVEGNPDFNKLIGSGLNEFLSEFFVAANEVIEDGQGFNLHYEPMTPDVSVIEGAETTYLHTRNGCHPDAVSLAEALHTVTFKS